MASFLSTIHVDQPLSNLAIQYKNADYVADKIFPQVQVNKRSDKYFIYTKSNAFNNISALTQHNADVGELGYSVSTGSYSVLDYALKKFVSRDEIENADMPLSPLIDATENITNALLLDREIKLATTLFSTSTFTGARLTDLSAATKWTSDSSEPIDQIFSAIDSIIGVEGPLCIMFGNDAWTSFRTHADVLSAIQFTQGGVAVTEQQVKDFFGLEDVVIGKASKNTANPGQTASYSRVWGDSVLIFKRNSQLKVKDAALGNCLRFGNMETQRWNDLSLGARGGEYVKVGWSYTDEITATDAGHLIYDVN